MSKFCIAHLSDLHIGLNQHSGYDTVRNELIDSLWIKLGELQIQLDALVVTGDIIDKGSIEAYSEAAAFFRSLMEKTGLSKEQVVMVPGNHDVPRSKLAKRDIRALAKNRNTLRDQSRWEEHWTVYGNRFQEYRQFLHDTTGNAGWTWGAYGSAMRDIAAREGNISILALNSAWTTCGDDDKNKLLILDAQFESLISLYKKKTYDLNVILMHHPLEWLIDDESSMFRSYLSRKNPGFDAILYGHVHGGDLSALVSPDLSTAYLTAGLGYPKARNDGGSYPDFGDCRYSIYEFDTVTGITRAWVMRTGAPGFFAPDYHLYRNCQPTGFYEIPFRKEPQITPTAQDSADRAALNIYENCLNEITQQFAPVPGYVVPQIQIRQTKKPDPKPEREQEEHGGKENPQEAAMNPEDWFEDISMDQVIYGSENYCLAAPSGHGKSSFLDYVGLQHISTWQETGAIEVLPIKLHVKYILGTSEGIVKTVKDNSGITLTDCDLTGIKILWLLDGLDQLPYNSDFGLLNEILEGRQHHLKQWGSSQRIIIATRPTYERRLFESLYGSPGDKAAHLYYYRYARLQPFDQERIKAYLGSEYSDADIETLSTLDSALLSIPMLLKMVKRVYRPGMAINNRFGLYQHYMEILKQEESKKKGLGRDKDRADQIEKDLAVISFRSLQEIGNIEPQGTFDSYGDHLGTISIEKIREYLDDDPHDTKVNRLKDWCTAHEILDSEYGTILSFTHQSFQEYFASLELADRLARSGGGETASRIIAECLEYAHWDEVWRFMNGRLPNAHKTPKAIKSDALQKALDSGTDSLASTMQYTPLINAELMRIAYPTRAISILTKLLEINSNSKDDRVMLRIIASKLGGIKDLAAVPELIRLVRDENHDVRGAAVDALGAIGDRAAVPELIKSLGDKDWGVRLIIVRALGKIKDPVAVPELIQLLRDESWDVRQASAEALGEIGDWAAVPELIRLLLDEDWRVRLIIVRALGKIKDPAAVSELIRLLRDKAGSVRVAAARALGAIKDPAATSELIRLVQDENWDVRQASAEALGEIGDRAAVPELIRLLLDEDGYVRRAAIRTLGDIRDPAMIPELFRLLRDEDWYVRREAARVLGEIRDRAAVPELIRLLQDEDGYVRQASAEALGEIGDRAAVPELIRLLQDKDWDVRVAAARALGEIRDRAAVPELIRLLQDEDGYVRSVAARALGAIKDRASVPELIRLLWDEDGNAQRSAAARALGRIRDPVAVPKRIRLVRDKNWNVLEAAAGALGEIGDPTAVPELIRLLSGEDWDVRQTAVQALGKIKDAAMVPELVRLLQDEDEYMRKAAAGALGEIKDPATVPELIKLLQHTGRYVRQAAIKALGAIKNRVAVSELIRLLRDEDGDVRQAAARALAEIGDPAAAPALIHSLQDVDSYVRQEAIQALGEIGDRAAVPELINSLGYEAGHVRQAAIQALIAIDPPMSLSHIRTRILEAMLDYSESIKYQEAAVEIMRQSPRRYLGILMGNEGD